MRLGDSFCKNINQLHRSLIPWIHHYHHKSYLIPSSALLCCIGIHRCWKVKKIGVPVVKGGQNLPPLVGIELTDLPKIGEPVAPLPPPQVPTSLTSDAASRWVGWALAHAEFGSWVNPIQPGGQIMPTTLLVAHPDLKTQRYLCWLSWAVPKARFASFLFKCRGHSWTHKVTPCMTAQS